MEPEDLCSLMVNCMEAKLKEPFVIAHGISDNRFKRLDLTETRQALGYSPQANAFESWGYEFVERSKPRD